MQLLAETRQEAEADDTHAAPSTIGIVLRLVGFSHLPELSSAAHELDARGSRILVGGVTSAAVAGFSTTISGKRAGTERALGSCAAFSLRVRWW